MKSPDFTRRCKGEAFIVKAWLITIVQIVQIVQIVRLCSKISSNCVRVPLSLLSVPYAVMTAALWRLWGKIWKTNVSYNFMSFHDQNIPAFESRATKRKNRQLIASTDRYARAGKLLINLNPKKSTQLFDWTTELLCFEKSTAFRIFRLLRSTKQSWDSSKIAAGTHLQCFGMNALPAARSAHALPSEQHLWWGKILLL